MTNEQLLERVLAKHELKIEISDPWVGAVQAKVLVPDLRQAPRALWGDWGPMYSVEVPSDTPVQLYIAQGPDAQPVCHVLDLPCLRVESPMSASVRERTPLYLDVPLHEKKITLRFHFDSEGRARDAEAIANGHSAPMFSIRFYEDLSEVARDDNGSGVRRMPSPMETSNAQVGARHG